MVMVLSFSVMVMANGINGKHIDYVALGDSNAAGVLFGSPTYPNGGTDLGYTDNIANKLMEAGILGSFNKDFAVSGKTAEILAAETATLNIPDTAEWHLIKDAEVVTLDIGANDLIEPFYACLDNFTNSQKMIIGTIIVYMQQSGSTDLMGAISQLVTAGKLNPTDVLVLLGSIKGALQQSLYELSNGKGLAVQDNIKTILQNILNANKKVKIYVMGYYNPLPTISAAYGMDLNPAVLFFNSLIQSAIADVVANNQSASITYVDTMSVMGSSNTYLVPVDIHPTVAGYQVIAEEFWSKIKLELHK